MSMLTIVLFAAAALASPPAFPGAPGHPDPAEIGNVPEHVSGKQGRPVDGPEQRSPIAHLNDLTWELHDAVQDGEGKLEPEEGLLVAEYVVVVAEDYAEAVQAASSFRGKSYGNPNTKFNSRECEGIDATVHSLKMFLTRTEQLAALCRSNPECGSEAQAGLDAAVASLKATIEQIEDEYWAYCW